MRRPPRPPGESIFAHGLGAHVIWVGALIAGLALLAEWLCVAAGAAKRQTMVFTVLTFAQMAHVLAVRSETQSLLSQGLLSNAPLAGAVALTVALQLAAIYVPAANAVFHTTPLSATELGLCFAAALAVLVAVEIEKIVRRRASW
jgi:Ca2+-transporting ATPase